MGSAEGRGHGACVACGVQQRRLRQRCRLQASAAPRSLPLPLPAGRLLGGPRLRAADGHAGTGPAQFDSVGDACCAICASSGRWCGWRARQRPSWRLVTQLVQYVSSLTALPCPHALSCPIREQTMLGAWDKNSGAGSDMGSRLAQRVAVNGLANSFMAFNTNYHDTGESPGLVIS